jgi:hypothetical protein
LVRANGSVEVGSVELLQGAVYTIFIDADKSQEPIQLAKAALVN